MVTKYPHTTSWKPTWARTSKRPKSRRMQVDVVPLGPGLTDTLTLRGVNCIDACRMVQPTAALGVRARIGCHTFRATGVTAYLKEGGSMENAYAMAADESPRATKFCDRTGDEITLDEVERIKM